MLAIEVLILALFASSLHAIMGPGGLASFGHAAYFGGGAYAAALAVSRLGWPDGGGACRWPRWRGPAGSRSSAGSASACAASTSRCSRWPSPRSPGRWRCSGPPLTGGDDGILGVWPAAWVAARERFYYLVLALVLLGILFLRRVTFAPFGYALRAGRDAPLRAEAIGIDVARQQWLAFALSGACAGLAGGLYLFSKGSIFPDEMSIARSFDALMMVLLGGVQTLAGPVVGATAFTLLEHALSRLELWRLLLGTAIVALVIAFPGGLAGLLRRPGSR